MGHRPRVNRARRPSQSCPLIRRVVVLILLACLLPVQCSVVTAQMAVFDASAYVQSVLEVAHTLNIVQLTLRDLAPMTEMGLVFELAVELQSIMTQVEGLTRAMEQRLAIYRTRREPVTSFRELAEFRSSVNQMCLAAQMDALTTQNLLSRMVRLLSTVQGMMNTLQQLLGSVAGMQMMGTTLSSIAGKLVLMQSMVASRNEAGLCEEWARAQRRVMMEQLIVRSLQDYGQVGPR